MADHGTLYQLCCVYGSDKKLNKATAIDPVKIPVKLGRPPRTRIEISNTTSIISTMNPVIIGVVMRLSKRSGAKVVANVK